MCLCVRFFIILSVFNSFEAEGECWVFDALQHAIIWWHTTRETSVHTHTKQKPSLNCAGSCVQMWGGFSGGCGGVVFLGLYSSCIVCVYCLV